MGPADKLTATARCVHCREEVEVPSTYAHGDHIKCGVCGTKHKVHRGDVLRLVIADITPLKEQLRDVQRLVERLEDEIAGARRSFGIGANGFGVGVIWVLYQVAIREQPWSTELVMSAVWIALGTGVALEAVNWLFLSKRQKIVRLTAELRDARSDGLRLQQMIREASRR